MAVVSLPVRDMGFRVADDLPLAWNRSIPELAVSANSISLLMPYVEPFIVRSVRGALQEHPGLDPVLRSRSTDFCRQELSHHAEHRRFNDILASQCAGIRRVEGWARRTFAWLQRTRSTRFKVAFAAGSETIAFGIARWAEKNMDRIFFRGTDPETVRLFLWHLAEEVEHKTAAFDVFEAVDGSRWRYLRATALSLALLVWFTALGNLTQLWRLRRLHLPVTWFRLVRWAVSLAFTMLPLVGVSCLRSHHPRQLVDPAYLTQWLRSPASRRPQHHGGEAGQEVGADDGEHEPVARAVEVAQVEATAPDGEGHGDGGEPGPVRSEEAELLGDELDHGR